MVNKQGSQKTKQGVFIFFLTKYTKLKKKLTTKEIIHYTWNYTYGYNLSFQKTVWLSLQVQE